MRNDSSSDVAASESDDEPSVTAVADEPAVTRERAPEVQPGDVLAGRYQIEAILGKGGSGIVLRAFDRVSATVVAVKVLKDGLTHDPRWEKRFSRELRLGRPIRHPNVCRIFDIGDADGYRFLTMEFATGGTLRDLVKKNQPRPLSERLADAAGAIAGLAAIHEAGIVHRDVKPDNMLRMADGRLVLSDFGLATDLPDSTMVSVFVGTPHYMAPEVREGDPATTRSDVWSLGVVLHEIVTGRRPERRNSRSGTSASKGPGTRTTSLIERAMLALCERCLADDPAERPENASAVERLFERARGSPRAILRSPHRRTIAFALAGVVVATVVGIRVKTARRPSASSEAQSPVRRLVPTGEPADWSAVAKTIAAVPGHVHCFSMRDERTARIVWGSPRRAEDIDIESGRRREARLPAEAFAVGCPETSVPAGRLLYVANNSSGASEIRLAESDDGRESKSLTAGSDPVWLRGGEEFVYTIDASHAAIFSLAMKTFRLMPDPDLGAQRIVLLEKAASPTSDAIALLFGTTDGDRVLAVYEGPALDHRSNFFASQGSQVQFDPAKGDVLISRQVSSAQSTMCLLDWRTGTFRNLGRYPTLDLIGVRFREEGAVVLGRRRSTDVWSFDGETRTRLTTDGENYTAAVSKQGVLLVSKRAEDGSVSIWRQTQTGNLKRMTEGALDVAPDFSPDGRRWVYTDYARKSVILCSLENDACSVLRRDELLPAAARFSRDGQRVAYVTQTAVGRLTVVSLKDGSYRQLGDATFMCPPIWSSASSVWSVEGTPGHYVRTEWNADRGERTGRRIPVATSLGPQGGVPCTPAVTGPESPFFERIEVRTEERSTLFRVPWPRR
jgi:serine/threonine protein kinase